MRSSSEGDPIPPLIQSGLVFIIDDAEAMQDLLSAAYADAGFSTLVAGSVADARRKMDQAREAVLISLDRELGDGLGDDLVPALRETIPGARIMMVTTVKRESVAGVDLDAFCSKGDGLESILTSAFLTLHPHLA